MREAKAYLYHFGIESHLGWLSDCIIATDAKLAMTVRAEGINIARLGENAACFRSTLNVDDFIILVF